MSLRPTHFVLLLASLVGCTDQPKVTTSPTAPAAAASPPALASAAPATTRYAGEYRWREADKKDMGGTLTVYPESDSTILFDLDSNSGGPAYNMAGAFGRAHLRGDTATYFGKAPEDEHGCRLKIGFSPQAAAVILVNRGQNDCYFGNSFTPEATYRRTSHTIPQWVISEGSDTLHFAHLPPDALKDSH